MNFSKKQKQSHLCRKQSYDYHWGKEGRINWEIGIDIYTLLYIKQYIYTHYLYMCSIGNSPQYSVMAYIEKNLKKQWICCVCVTDSICCTPEINKTLKINYALINKISGDMTLITILNCLQQYKI